MKTATRGNAAEARVLAEFVGRGFDVLVPFGGGQPYDLGVDDSRICSASFLPSRDSVYLVPLDAVGGFNGRLRLTPPRNNQRSGIRFAADFEIGSWTEEKLRALSA